MGWQCWQRLELYLSKVKWHWQHQLHSVTQTAPARFERCTSPTDARNCLSQWVPLFTHRLALVQHKTGLSMAHNMALYWDFTETFFVVKTSQVADCKLPQWWKRDLRTCGVLCSAERYPVISYPLGSIGPLFRDPLTMGPIGCPEMSVRNCHCSPYNNPEECRSQNVARFHSANVNVPSCIALSKIGLCVLLEAQWLLQVHLCVETHFIVRTVCTVHTYMHTCTYAHVHTHTHIVRVATLYYVLRQHFPICLWLQPSTFSLKQELNI